MLGLFQVIILDESVTVWSPAKTFVPPFIIIIGLSDKAKTKAFSPVAFALALF